MTYVTIGSTCIVRIVRTFGAFRRSPGSASRPASSSCSPGRSGCRSSSTRRRSRGWDAGSRWPSSAEPSSRGSRTDQAALAVITGGRRRRSEPPSGSSVTSTASTPSSEPGTATSAEPSSRVDHSTDGRLGVAAGPLEPDLVDAALRRRRHAFRHERRVVVADLEPTSAPGGSVRAMTVGCPRRPTAAGQAPPASSATTPRARSRGAGTSAANDRRAPARGRRPVGVRRRRPPAARPRDSRRP